MHLPCHDLLAFDGIKEKLIPVERVTLPDGITNNTKDFLSIRVFFEEHFSDALVTPTIGLVFIEQMTSEGIFGVDDSFRQDVIHLTSHV